MDKKNSCTLSLLCFCVLLALTCFHELRAQSLRKRIKSAYVLYEEGRYRDAVVQLDLAEQGGSERAYLYYLRGACKAMLTEHRAALDDFEMALRHKKRYPEVYFEMGLSYFSLHDNLRALEALDKAIGQDPKYAAAYFNRGTVKCALDDREGARQDWSRAYTLGLELPIHECD